MDNLRKNMGGNIMQVKDNAEMKKQEQDQIVELGSDLSKNSKGNIFRF